jgi:hypothetical protein
MVALTFRRLEQTLLTLREAPFFWGFGTKQGAAFRCGRRPLVRPARAGHFSDITRFFSM